MPISFFANLKYKIAYANTLRNTNGTSTFDSKKAALMELVSIEEILEWYLNDKKVFRSIKHLLMHLKVTRSRKV